MKTTFQSMAPRQKPKRPLDLAKKKKKTLKLATHNKHQNGKTHLERIFKR